MAAAVKAADLSELKSLLVDSGKVNSIFPNGKTLLIMAIEEQNLEMVEFLIRAGADLEKRDFYDHTPLMYAARMGQTEITAELLKAGADVNAKNKQGRTALTYTRYKKMEEAARILMQAGAKDPSLDPGTRTRRSPNKLQNLLATDEFSELRNLPAWPGYPSTLWLAAILLPMFVGGLPRWSPLSWLILAWVTWCLLLWFPSIWLIFPQGWELLRMSRGFYPATAPRHPQPAPAVAPPGDEVSFVSFLMDLGARELASLHRTHANRQSLHVQRAIWMSGILSVLLAAPFLILAIIFLTFASADMFDGLETFMAYTCVFYLVVFLWSLVSFKLEKKLRVRRLRLVQQDRDRIAGEISRLLNAEEFHDKALPDEFGLYLRAFMTTDKLPIKGFDFETMLAYSIAPTLPLLALGRPGEHLGAGRIRTSNEHWKEEILRLMEAARLIFIIPSHRRGTLWEITTLVERGLIEKTIFIMPPEMHFLGDRYSSDWQKTVLAARQEGVEFPYHIPTGAFFRINASGEFEDYAPCLPEEFIGEADPEPWQARAGGSIEAAVEESSMAVTSLSHGHAIHDLHVVDPFHHADNALDYADSGHAVADLGDAGGHDIGDPGDYSHHGWS